MMSSVVKEETQVGGEQKVLPEHAMKCPRCDSSDTKFCYYNNYSLSQPRHFCKTCRRYWTKGGTLRNVPVGGGCRKSKKAKTPNLSLELFNGLYPAMDFQLDGLQLCSSSVITLHFPLLAGLYGGQLMYSNSLSSINEDLHCKLQQQRLHGRLSTDQMLHPIYFQNLDLSEPAQIETSGNGRKEGEAATDRLFGTSFAAPNGGGAATSSSWNGVHAWNNHLSSSDGRFN